MARADYFNSLQRFTTFDRLNVANFTSYRNLKATKSRPLSAQRASPARSKRSSSKGYEATSRDDKAEENLQLRTQLNSLKSELLKLRVKLKTTETEARRDDPASERKTVVLALKQQTKELTKQLQTREKELEELRRSVKATSFQELEVQVKIYIDECTRLRRLLTEALQQLAEGAEMGDIAERYLTLSIQFRDLKKEHEGLAEATANLRVRKKSGKGEDHSEKLKRTLAEVQEENTRVHRDKQHLINKLQSVKQTLKCPNYEQALSDALARQTRTVAEVVAEIWGVLQQKGLSLKEAWGLVDVSRLDILKSSAFAEGLTQLGVTLSSIELTKLMLELNPVQGNKVSFAQFEAAMAKHKQQAEVDVDEVYTHVRMKLQVQRWEYDQLPALLVPERRDYFPDEICSTLEQEPFELSKEQAKGLVSSLFDHSPSLRGTVIARRFTDNLDSWAVLTDDEEQALDDLIREALSQQNGAFVELCTAKDRKSAGIISYKDFEDILRSMKAELSGEELEYIKLLCYTHNFELNSVPYLHLASAYVDEAYTHTKLS
jgi:Ca2+-binding EF-hand superfamily protein